MKRKIIYIGLLIIVVLFSILFFLNNQKYSLAEINADNYLVLLEKDKSQSLAYRGGMLTKVIEIPAILVEARNIKSLNGYKISDMDYFDTPSGAYVLNFLNLASNTTYGIEFKNKSSDIVTGVKISNRFSDDGSGIIGGEDIVKKLTMEEEFVFKESAMKGHLDIIIRDLGDLFLIGSITKEEKGTISSIDFHLFKKKKYFKSW